MKKETPALLRRLQQIDTLPKTAIIILLATVSYLILSALLKPLFIVATPDHSTMMGDHMMSFSSPEQTRLSLSSIVGALVIATVLAFMFSKPPTQPIQKESKISHEEASTKELAIIKRVLSADERKLVSNIEETGEITQDSLTFRLDWSRAKISTILTNLERSNVIQRRREGKTYVVFIAKKK